MTLKELLEEFADNEVEIVTDIDDFIDKLEKTMDDEDEPKEELKKEATETEEDDVDIKLIRGLAKEARAEAVKKFGKDRADKITRLATCQFMIQTLMDKNVPIQQSMVDEFNKLCVELTPEFKDDFGLSLTYTCLRMIAEKGESELG